MINTLTITIQILFIVVSDPSRVPYMRMMRKRIGV